MHTVIVIYYYSLSLSLTQVRRGGEPHVTFCLLEDPDNCLHTVPPLAMAVPLRVPGNAACLQLDDPSRPLSQQTCNAAEARQRWRYMPPAALTLLW